ncbi:hypothetical protein F511_19432 [Dorcoceras hygrometricum]|uniref:Protein kinase domain-containing protein n=1 Tax=Dorcoceras hygrometricum TaxID=472368 RepID=A0A2Z7CSL8_9LAMI|nr:hypothetical protein F511_19432 [Dorcoceras hygrometricum]
MNRKIQEFFLIIAIISCTLCQVHSQNKTSNNTSSAYTDSYVLACGATADATDANGRKWIQDIRFLTSPNESSSAMARTQDPSLPSTVPYMKARVFYSKATYRFPVSPMFRHWIRLHFYPSWYKDLDPSNSFFSVTAGGFTLVNNFSASITAQALTQAYIVREFALPRLDSGILDLTFTPSPTYNGSFAFVNGIEVILLPDIFHPVSMTGLSDKNLETEHQTFQTMFRLNVGGQYVPASKDSGLTRTWYDDSPYIFGAAFGVTSEADNNETIKYPYDELKYIAPYNVYRTARSMGPNSSINQNYNLTWVFRIDVNFMYLVRLHFCEFYFEKVNQRVFSIFINNQMAEEEADVIAWAKSRGVPVYKDFAVYVNGRTGDDQMFVSLHPNVGVKPEYYDSVLNGLEIFKFNDTRGNLAGPNPMPELVKTELRQGKSVTTSKLSKHGIITGSVIGSLVVFGLVGLAVFLKQTKSRTYDASSRIGGWFPIYGSSHSSGTRTTSKNSQSSRISNLGGVHCRHFTLAELRLATNDFSESSVIGFGGFGKVYRGFIDGNTKKVAIKRANPSSDQGVHEFLNEIELLSKLRHRHLVSLIGACEENDEMILVYDYMGNGTLREHLYNSENPSLNWTQRLDICIGAARGIHYLHTGARHMIIHRDVKSTNILLDEKCVAKVSDFGLSKTGPTLDQTHISTIVKGSFGYLDPEYFLRQQLTDKSDVYSFGVVLFEVLCGRPALNPSLPKEQVSLADWALLNHKRDTLEQIVDQHIIWEINPECLKHFAETAAKCLSDYGLDRPSMGSVLRNLEYCHQLQTNPDVQNVAAKQKADDATQNGTPKQIHASFHLSTPCASCSSARPQVSPRFRQACNLINPPRNRHQSLRLHRPPNPASVPLPSWGQASAPSTSPSPSTNYVSIPPSISEPPSDPMSPNDAKAPSESDGPSSFDITNMLSSAKTSESDGPSSFDITTMLSSAKPSESDGPSSFDISKILSSIKVDPEVEKICESTDHPALCIATVAPLLNGKNVDVKSVLEVAMKAGSSFTEFVLSFATKLAEKPGTPPEMKSILSDCKDSFDTALSNFEESITALSQDDIGTMNSMLSAVMTFVGDCEDSFDGMGMDSPFMAYSDKLTNMTSNCLAIISLMN